MGFRVLTVNGDLKFGDHTHVTSTISRSGFAPALSGDPEQFLSGVGTYGRGVKVYQQPDEPEDAQPGDIWIQTT